MADSEAVRIYHDPRKTFATVGLLKRAPMMQSRASVAQPLRAQGPRSFWKPLSDVRALRPTAPGLRLRLPAPARTGSRARSVGTPRLRPVCHLAAPTFVR